MRIIPCPICGRMPRIDECAPHKNQKVRICGCPKYCSVIPCEDHLNRSWFTFNGDGDDNAIYKEWNQAIGIYEYNKSEPSWKKWQYYIPRGEINL